jgi:hypothetical protein
VLQLSDISGSIASNSLVVCGVEEDTTLVEGEKPHPSNYCDCSHAKEESLCIRAE